MEGSGGEKEYDLVDLLGVVLVVATTLIVIYVPPLGQTPLRVLIGLAFVLFVPGYALVAALFPASRRSRDERDDSEGRGLTWFERLSLSVGSSVAMLPFVGIALDRTPYGIDLTPVVVSVSVLTIVVTVVAAWRRRNVPPEDRLRVPYERSISRGRAGLLQPDSRLDVGLNALLVISLLLVTVTAGYALATPTTDAPFTEFYLLTENEDGDLVAGDYPQQLTAGENSRLAVGIENHEQETVSYTVVVRLQKFDVSDGTREITEQEAVETFQGTLAHNESRLWSHQVTPTVTGERVRLTYLLFQDSVPAEPSVENAYRETHLWVNVSSAES